jgi:hypothetical protein
MPGRGRIRRIRGGLRRTKANDWFREVREEVLLLVLRVWLLPGEPVVVVAVTLLPSQGEGDEGWGWVGDGVD